MDAIFTQKGLFEEIKNTREDVAALIESRFAELLTEVKTLLDRDGDDPFALVENVTHSDVMTANNFIVSFGRKQKSAYLYIGRNLLKSSKIKVGQKVYFGVLDQNKYFDFFALSVAPSFYRRKYEVCRVPRVNEIYYRVGIPLDLIPFSIWKGRKEFEAIAQTGSIFFKIPK